jgi:hypothetical protein
MARRLGARLRAARAAPSGDRGAAVIDFVMMSVLLVFLLFAVLQVAVYFYARNIIAASAADAARYAANAGVDPASGGPRADELIRHGLGSGTGDRIPCHGGTTTDPATGLTVATVHCRGRLKLTFLPLSLPLWIDVRTSALKEGTP